MAKLSPWMALVKKQLDILLAEGRLKGISALREAIKRSRRIYIRSKSRKLTSHHAIS